MLKRIALICSLAAALAWPALAVADVTVPTYKDSAGFSHDAIGVVPLNTGGTASTTDVNVTQVNGVAVKTGAGTASGAQRVELPTDGTGKVGLNAGTALVGKVGIDQTTPGTTNLVSIGTNGSVTNLASENHIGEIGNNQTTISVAQTVTASSAYASGNAVGGWITFANAARVSAGSGLIQNVTVNSKSAQTTQMDLLLFNSDVTGTSTCTDKTAVAIATTDVASSFGVAHIADWTSFGTPSVGQADNLAKPFKLASGTSLYGCLVTRSTPTFTATTDITVELRDIRN